MCYLSVQEISPSIPIIMEQMMYTLSVGTSDIVFGVTHPDKSIIYALVKNAMLWHFCLRRARSLRLDTLAFDSHHQLFAGFDI